MKRGYWKLVAVMVIGISGCAAVSEHGEKKDAPAQKVSLSQIPSPARATIERLTAGGQIKKIEKEQEHGKVIYDVEAMVKGKEVEYDVADDGTVLTSEESIAYDLLPAAVKTAVQKYFGSAEGLKASREIEKAETFYEVEGSKAGAKIALKLSDTGKILEEEK
ncbi:MAG TPA: PepSY-like domain-containing protein [Sedimentisphaerales bacterium]|nr:PepSY-like domain-containing protein [Sedimentisphaerales bacterium]